MMVKNLFTNISTGVKISLVLAALLAAGGYIAWISEFRKEHSYQNFTGAQVSTYPRPQFEITGLDNPSSVKAELQWQKKILPMNYKDGVLSLPLSGPVPGVVLPPYKLVLTEQRSPGQYRDLSFTIGADGKKIDFLVDGFSPRDKASMAFGDQIAFDNIPLDWSGRLDLNTILDSNVPMPTCVWVSEESKKLRICHSFPIGWGA